MDTRQLSEVDKTCWWKRGYWHESRQQISADGNARSSACGRVWGRHPVYAPNPIGEKLYRTQLIADTLPVAIIAGGLLLAWLLYTGYQKDKKKLTANEAGWYQI